MPGQAHSDASHQLADSHQEEDTEEPIEGVIVKDTIGDTQTVPLPIPTTETVREDEQEPEDETALEDEAVLRSDKTSVSEQNSILGSIDVEARLVELAYAAVLDNKRHAASGFTNEEIVFASVIYQAIHLERLNVSGEQVAAAVKEALARYG
jgi:hypothetical protein